MPRLSDTRNPKLCHNRKRDRAYVSINGKKIDCGKWGSREAEEKYAAIIAEWVKVRRNPVIFEAVRPSAARSKTVSVAELCEKYLNYAVDYYGGEKHPTFRCYKEAVAELSAPLLKLPVSEFTPKKLKAIAEIMIVRGLSLSTINQRTGRIKAIFRWGVAEELVAPDTSAALYALRPLQKGRSKAKESIPVEPVSREIVERTIAESSSVIGAMIGFTLHSACRPSETCIVRACDIDMTGDVWVFRPFDHKMKSRGRQKEIFIGKAGQEILRPFLERKANNPEAYLFDPHDAITERKAKDAANRKSEHFTPSRIARDKQRTKRPRATIRDHYDKDSFSCALDRAIGRVNRKAAKEGGEPIPQWNLGQLRHTRLTEVRKVAGLEAAQIVGGHSFADVTQIYAERDQAKAFEVFANLED